MNVILYLYYCNMYVLCQMSLLYLLFSINDHLNRDHIVDSCLNKSELTVKFGYLDTMIIFAITVFLKNAHYNLKVM